MADRPVMARDGTGLLTGADSARQRLRDALSTPRGSYPFMRDYGSELAECTDRRIDSALAAKLYAAVAGAIAHPPNGLDDIALDEVLVESDGAGVDIVVRAYWTGENASVTPIGVRERLVRPPPVPAQPLTPPVTPPAGNVLTWLGDALTWRGEALTWL